MQIHLQAARAGEIALSPDLPASLQAIRAPESNCYGAAGPFGHVLFQEMDGEGISIRHCTFYFEEEDRLLYESEEPALRLQVILNNSYYGEAEGLGEMVLHERGFSLNYVPRVHHQLQVHAKGSYAHLSVYYRPQDLEVLQSSFPELPEFLRKVKAGVPSCYNTDYCIAKAPMITLVHHILECTYTGAVRRLYLNSLSMEILVLALVAIGENRNHPKRPPIEREEAEWVYAAKTKVMAKMNENVSLPKVAEWTGQSAYKLNSGWRSIYGINVMDWVHEIKMEIAHNKLQDEEMPMLDVAEVGGYSTVTAFNLAFKKHFGYNPGFVRKSASF